MHHEFWFRYHGFPCLFGNPILCERPSHSRCERTATIHRSFGLQHLLGWRRKRRCASIRPSPEYNGNDYELIYECAACCCGCQSDYSPCKSFQAISFIRISQRALLTCGLCRKCFYFVDPSKTLKNAVSVLTIISPAFRPRCSSWSHYDRRINHDISLSWWQVIFSH